MHKSVQRVRYPPFDHENSDPEGIPLVEVLLESETPPPPEFKIGNDKSWLLEWRPVREKDVNLPMISKEVTYTTLPFLMRTRNGWYIEPDPLHKISRKTIFPGVFTLVTALLLHALEPALINIELIPNDIFTSISIGPLDYPLMIVLAFPVFMLPILVRVLANIKDIRRQNEYIANPLPNPEIEIKNVSTEFVEISNIDLPKGIVATRARIQVGVAIPEREVLLRATGRRRIGQPPPGMSTELPERRITTADEHGTGVGESLPMTVGRGRLLHLEPMRIQDFGPWELLRDFPLKISGPPNPWPGTIYSAMIAIHWEIVIEAEKDGGLKMKWVRPITVDFPSKEIGFQDLPIRSGRSEA